MEIVIGIVIVLGLFGLLANAIQGGRERKRERLAAKLETMDAEIERLEDLAWIARYEENGGGEAVARDFEHRANLIREKQRPVLLNWSRFI